MPLFGGGAKAVDPVAKASGKDENRAPLYHGTPRVLLSGRDPRTLQTAGASLSYEVMRDQQTKTKFEQLMHLVPSECWVGPTDTVPGLLATIPPQIKDFNEKEAYCPRTTLYAHRVRLSSMQEVEAAFAAYLRRLCHAEENQPNQQAPTIRHAAVTDRRLTVASHNTWRQLESRPSDFSLVLDLQGNIEGAGSALRIPDYAVTDMVALIFKLEYRGKSKAPNPLTFHFVYSSAQRGHPRRAKRRG